MNVIPCVQGQDDGYAAARITRKDADVSGGSSSHGGSRDPVKHIVMLTPPKSQRLAHGRLQPRTSWGRNRYDQISGECLQRTWRGHRPSASSAFRTSIRGDNLDNVGAISLAGEKGYSPEGMKYPAVCSVRKHARRHRKHRHKHGQDREAPRGTHAMGRTTEFSQKPQWSNDRVNRDAGASSPAQHAAFEDEGVDSEDSEDQSSEDCLQVG